jgi:hypothetical protein
MTVESDIYTTLKGLVGNRCFPDMAPIATVRPYITYTQIGGEAYVYLDGTLADKKNGRFQVNVWADSRSSASTVMLQVESAMVQAAAFNARPVSAPSSAYDYDMQVYGSMQDFSVNSTR